MLSAGASKLQQAATGFGMFKLPSSWWLWNEPARACMSSAAHTLATASEQPVTRRAESVKLTDHTQPG